MNPNTFARWAIAYHQYLAAFWREDEEAQRYWRARLDSVIGGFWKAAI